MARIIGVDAGGTSTRAIAVDASGGAPRVVQAEGANWTVHGPDLCQQRIEGLVAALVGSEESPSALCLCIAGYYPPDHAQAADAWAERTWPGTAVRVEPDVMAAWAGALAGEPGLVLISGTGSICYGRNARGEAARAGGWGPLFGDAGSAYAVGVECLRAIAEQVDGMGPATALSDQLPARHPELGGEPREWLRGIYRQGWGREQVAALAAEVARAADAGDPVAAGILRSAAEDLARMALAVERRLDEADLPLALQGGLGASPLIRQGLQAALTAGPDTLRLVENRYEPLYGALLLAAEAHGGASFRTEVLERLPGPVGREAAR